jgi:hypothetical protein
MSVTMRYGSITRKNFKTRWGLQGKIIEDHHVIPKQWKNHAIVKKFGYDIDDHRNLIMMPTKLGVQTMGIRANRMTHNGCHVKYNRYVGTILNSIKTEEDLYYFRDFLKSVCRFNHDIIPWY